MMFRVSSGELPGYAKAELCVFVHLRTFNSYGGLSIIEEHDFL